MSAHRVMIDRLVLTDLGIPVERAERIRELVSAELARTLAREGWPQRRSPATSSGLVAPTIDLPGAATDPQLAATLATGLARALSGASEWPSEGKSHVRT